MTKALVIDDKREMADSLSKMLSLLNIDADVAYGSRSAMQTLMISTPDVVFLDISMPGVDGFEVLGYLRRVPGMGKTPVVVVTSDDQPETYRKAEKGGALALIVKPATLEAIEAVLLKAKLI
jgi:CheY-like chemotaxis protein